MTSRLANRRQLFWLFVLLAGCLSPREGRAQVTQCIDCGVPYSVEVTPDGLAAKKPTQGTYTAIFTVRNNGDNTNTYGVECGAIGVLTCGTVSPASFTLGTFTQTAVSVTYTTSGTVGTGTLTLEASGIDAHDVGSYTITTVAPPNVALEIPTFTTGNSAVVRTRQPVIRALFTSVQGSGVDSTPTLSWRGENVTQLARRNKGLIEWQVDSTRWLATGGAGAGDSALISVTACAQVVACRTVTRWAVLLNDQKPVLGFTGMPLEALGRQFSAPFGPGLSVSGAEIQAGISTIPYFSMGSPRSFGLTYSTRQSYPRALVPVDLELPWPTGTPDQIKIVLLDGTTRLDSLVLSSPSCATGALKRCRAVLQADEANTTFLNPVRKWLTVEASVTQGATTRMGSDSVEVVFVDRRNSPYGSGWWPSMFLQLTASGESRVLVGPDGSATIFRGNGDSLYLSAPGDFSRLVKIANGWELHPRGTTAKLVFDGAGRLFSFVDANGNADVLAYHASIPDRLNGRQDPAGKLTSLSYDGSGRLTTIFEAGRFTDIQINASNQLVYDSLSSPIGKPLTNRYVYRTYPGTQTVVLLKRIGVLLDTTIVTYDSTFQRRPTKVRLPRVEDETGAVVTPTIQYTAYERQGFGALQSLDNVYVELKDPRNNWTRSLLNRWGQARKSWDVVGVLSRAQYDPDGLLQWSEGKVADSSRVYQTYDSKGRLVKTFMLRTATDTFRLDSLVYDTQHRVIQRVDPRAKATSVTYDANGNVLTATDPAGNISRTWYSSNGLIDSTRAPGNSASQRFSYDATWKQLSVAVDETGDTVTRVSYDTYGRATINMGKLRVQASSGSAMNLQWRRTTTSYRDDNLVDTAMVQRTDNCTDPCATPTWYPAADTLHTEKVIHVYDRAGRDSVRRNDRLVSTLYVYDRLGRLLRRQPWADSAAALPVGVRDSLVYDVAGDVVKTITRRGDVITTVYDSRNRPASSVIPGVGTRNYVYGGPLDQLTRTYDVAPVDSIGAVTTELRRGYDQRGRLKADTSYTGATARVTAYAYDTYERPSTLTDPLGTWTTRYDATRGLPATLVTPFADSLLYTYDPQGRAVGPTILSSGPSIQRSLGWLQNGMLSTLQTKVNTGISYRGGEYSRVLDMPDDPVPLNPTWVEQPGSGASAVTRLDSTSYDGWERVTKWVQLKNNVAVTSETMQYDRIGNVLTGDAETYDSVTSRLTSRTVGGHRFLYAFDRAGNLVQERDSTLSSGAVVTLNYGYDVLNQLRSVRQGTTLVARYAYDVSGRRIVKRIYSSVTGGVTAYTRFVYHGSHVAFEADSGSVANPGGAIGLRYTWGQGTDDLVGVRDAAGTQYYTVQDKVGSIRGLVRRDGSWVLNLTYGPWGRVVDSAGTQHSLLRYRWTSREYDSETGFYFHRTRYYSPMQRRFIQEDPIGYGGGHNLYAYVDGHLFEAVDPEGTRLVDVNGGHGGGGGYNPGRNDMGFGDRGTSGWDDFNIWRVRIDATGDAILPVPSGAAEAIIAQMNDCKNKGTCTQSDIAYDPDAAKSQLNVYEASAGGSTPLGGVNARLGVANDVATGHSIFYGGFGPSFGIGAGFGLQSGNIFASLNSMIPGSGPRANAQILNAAFAEGFSLNLPKGSTQPNGFMVSFGGKGFGIWVDQTWKGFAIKF